MRRPRTALLELVVAALLCCFDRAGGAAQEHICVPAVSTVTYTNPRHECASHRYHKGTNTRMTKRPTGASGQ